MATAEETIRDWLYEVDGDTVTYAALGQANAAILAVFDLHRTHPVAGMTTTSGLALYRCEECDFVRVGESECDTVRAVAAALGCGEQT